MNGTLEEHGRELGHQQWGLKYIGNEPRKKFRF